MNEYNELKARLAKGWNTWNTRSVLSHVLLPQAFAVNICLKEYSDGAYLKEGFIGRAGKDEEVIIPGPRTYNGGYTELNLKWKQIEATIQSATDGDDLVLLITPLAQGVKTPTLVIEAGILWNRDGYVIRDGEVLLGKTKQSETRVYLTHETVEEPFAVTQTPYLAVTLSEPVGVSTGKRRSVDEIKTIIETNKAAHQTHIDSFGELSEVYAAMQTCLAWDTIYEPSKNRVVSPVSRLWSCGAGGFALFCWDNYFASLIASVDNKEIAYSNAIEMTIEVTESGFVPNVSIATGFKSRDRSQPPVGSMAVRELYRRYGDRWLLEELFDTLLSWNLWWYENRRNDYGLLSWGSNPYPPTIGNYWETTGVDDRFGGSLESGLDNSPMYDYIPFDKEKHQLVLADAGLSGLYAMDCLALAEIADTLGKTTEAEEIRGRASEVQEKIQLLWDEDSGIFKNRRTETGELSMRLSPTNFYPLLGRAASQEQAERMVAEHLYNPEEFWGDWVIPSISRNDQAYLEQDYWRGRIWAPMNFLVYLGLRNYDLPQAQADLAAKSRELLLKEWLERGHVHENYNAETGEGCDVLSSDRFYHWGGLLGLISFFEAGYFD